MPPTPVILREAEGEVAESTDMNEPTPSRRGGTSIKIGDGRGRTFFHPLILQNDLIPKGEDFPLIFEMWILQLRASPACRMTCE